MKFQSLYDALQVNSIPSVLKGLVPMNVNLLVVLTCLRVTCRFFNLMTGNSYTLFLLFETSPVHFLVELL